MRKNRGFFSFLGPLAAHSGSPFAIFLFLGLGLCGISGFNSTLRRFFFSLFAAFGGARPALSLLFSCWFLVPLSGIGLALATSSKRSKLMLFLL